MSKDLIRRNAGEVVDNKDLVNTLNKLAITANDSVDEFIKNAPKLQEITETILGVLSKENEINNLEHKDLLKLFELSTKLQMQPLEQFTKLFVQMNQFQEKLNINKELDVARGITIELKKAKKEAEDILEYADEVTEDNVEADSLLSKLVKSSK